MLIGSGLLAFLFYLIVGGVVEPPPTPTVTIADTVTSVNPIDTPLSTVTVLSATHTPEDPTVILSPTTTQTPTATPSTTPAPTITIIRLAEQANASPDFEDPPAEIEYKNVSFYVGDRIFKSQAAPMPDNSFPTEIRLPVDVSRAYKVHILLNAGNAFLRFDRYVIGDIVVYCDGEETIVDYLQLGRNIREWHVANNVVSTATETEQVWRGPIAGYQYEQGHIDLLSFDLPPQCTDSALDVLLIRDTSISTTGSLDPALNLFAITVEHYE